MKRSLTSAGTKNICAVCPETAGGLQSPRPPAEYTEDGRILDSKGKDVTEAFELGAHLSLEKALKKAFELGEDIEGAVLKANSPLRRAEGFTTELFPAG